MSGRQRVAAALLAVSAAGLAGWIASEGESPAVPGPAGTTMLAPHIPTKGDVPTIGHGSTRYEDGTWVTLADPPITRQRARELATNLMQRDCSAMARTMPGVRLHQAEYDLYCDFVGQYGIGNWQKPKSPRTWLMGGDYVGACEALLNWRFAAGYDCSTPGNKRCWGVWARQQKRHAACMAAQ